MMTGGNTKSGDVLVFRGRLLLKIISSGLLAVWIAMAVSLAVAAVMAKNLLGKDLLLLFGLPIFLLVSAMFLNLANDSFSSIRLDGDGLQIRKWFFSKDIPWNLVGRVSYWVVIESVQGVSSEEPNISIRAKDGKRFCLIKSTYEKEAIPAILNAAAHRGIEILQSRD